ncbi:hypothetical protein HZC53_01860 [Candidatus Uhrbacteria bacterium]|nr:hypothetical protein [Candidatus Uhrbacteria bacterium]
MPDVIGAFAPRRPRVPENQEAPLREVHAEFVSLGGAVILSVCIILTLVTAMSFLLPAVSDLQRVILLILSFICWVYLLDSVTEKLRLDDEAIEFRSLLSRRRTYQVSELEAVLLIHEGFNLERGFESVEFRRVGRRPDRIALGPCWQRNKLERLMRSVELELNDPHLLEEVR